MEQLERSYQKIMQQVHPDRLQNQELQQRLAAQYATLTNDAYPNLKDPVRRAVYLLQLQDISIDMERCSVHDVDFLTQLMSWQETLEDIHQSPKNIENAARVTALSHVRQDVKQHIRQQENRFNHFYTQLADQKQPQSATEKTKAAIKAEVQDAVLRMRFLYQILQS